MSRIDDLIDTLPALTDEKRALWATNAARVIARGPRRNRDYADALRVRDALLALDALRPAEAGLIAAAGLDWDRLLPGRTTFRGFDGGLRVARVTRIRPNRFVAEVNGAPLPAPFTTLSAARLAAAGAYHAGADDAPADLARAA